MFQRILIPLDGSSVAEQVLPVAKMFVVRFSSTVVLFQAIEPVAKTVPVQEAASHGEDQAEAQRKKAEEYLEGIAREFPSGVAVQPEVRIGSPATTILEFAESDHIDLIAMATHGRTGVRRWAYGSVADKVLTGGQHPMLLVRASQAPHAMAPITRILVPLDGSALAGRALIPAQQLAQAFNAEILLMRVQEPSAYGQGEPAAGMYSSAFDDALQLVVREYLTEKAQALRGQHIRVGWESPFGMPAESILEVAEKRAANLVVMSTHGRSGVGRWIMGSVADRVLRSARVPVLLIRTGAATE